MMTYYPKRTTIFMFIYLFFVCLMNFKELNGSRNHEQFPEFGMGITSKMTSAHFFLFWTKSPSPPPPPPSPLKGYIFNFFLLVLVLLVIFLTTFLDVNFQHYILIFIECF